MSRPPRGGRPWGVQVDERHNLKHYEILSPLGEGGMGVVYRARDTRLGRTVALKVLPREFSGDEERSRRFEREARIVSALSHPGIATLYDFDRDGDDAFIAMELIEGPTLRELVSRGPLPVETAIECAVQVAEALAAAHREGVVHRDLKPENIMVAGSGYYKVLDFGVARIDGGQGASGKGPEQTPTRTWSTRAGGLLGTVAYMSPEQAMGLAVDARSDIFSFGALLYEMLAGKPAFRGGNEIATARAILDEQPEPLRTTRPEIPPGLAAVVETCLAKGPDDRYPTADALAGDLRTLRADSLSGARRSEPLLALRAARRRRARRIALSLTAAMLAVAVLVPLWMRYTRVPGTGARLDPAASLMSRPPPVGSAAAGSGSASSIDSTAREGLAPGSVLPASLVPLSSRPRVIVAFFENNSGDPSADWLSRGLPEMLTTDLSRSGDLEVIATQRLYDLLAASGRDTRAVLDRSTATELARWARADVVISGSVYRQAARYRLDAQAYDTSTGTVLAAHKTEGEDLFTMVSELTSALRQGLLSARGGATAPVVMPAVMRMTSSEEAFRHYTKGKTLFESLLFREAETELRASLEADPEFALARFRLALNMAFSGQRQAALPLLARVISEKDRLPEEDRLLAQAWDAYLRRSDAGAAISHLEELVRRKPGDEDALVLWARVLSDLKRSPIEATGKLREAIAADPNYLPAIAALATQMADLGEQEAALGILREAIKRNPESGAGLGRLMQSWG